MQLTDYGRQNFKDNFNEMRKWKYHN